MIKMRRVFSHLIRSVLEGLTMDKLQKRLNQIWPGWTLNEELGHGAVQIFEQ